MKYRLEIDIEMSRKLTPEELTVMQKDAHNMLAAATVVEEELAGEVVAVRFGPVET